MARLFRGKTVPEGGEYNIWHRADWICRYLGKSKADRMTAFDIDLVDTRSGKPLICNEIKNISLHKDAMRERQIAERAAKDYFEGHNGRGNGQYKFQRTGAYLWGVPLLFQVYAKTDSTLPVQPVEAEPQGELIPMDTYQSDMYRWHDMERCYVWLVADGLQYISPTLIQDYTGRMLLPKEMAEFVWWLREKVWGCRWKDQTERNE